MKILVTAGQVYGRLDDNKLVGNRVRGIWAIRFAEHLLRLGHDVTLLIADTQTQMWGDVISEKAVLTVVRHHGYQDYRLKCVEFARTHNAAVMAAAVVNWIPSHPFKGKMPTKGYKTGDTINIEFVLAPRVIDEMKEANSKLTLIGCKMLIDSTEEELVTAAYDVLLRARCNVVVANDMGHGLKRKLLVYQDRSVHEYDNDFEGFFEALVASIEDEHYSTNWTYTSYPVAASGYLFDEVVEKYRDRFLRRQPDGDRVFGAVFVPTGDIAEGIVSPREKGLMFTARDAVILSKVEGRKLTVEGPHRATLNAPLLLRVAKQYPQATAILHLHEQLPNVPTVPYAPPGTVRDNEREIPGPVFNIEGHGFIACLNESLEIVRL